MEPSPSYTPWYERRQLCAEATAPAGCYWSSFVKLECGTEPNELGVPVKRCVRLHKKLLHCPGRPAKVAKEQQEILTLAGDEAELPLPEPVPFGNGSSASPSGHGLPGGAAAGPAAASSGSDGQDLEHLLRLADELHERIAAGGLQLDPELEAEARPYSEKEQQQQQQRGGGEGGILSRLKGLWQARRTTLDEKAWQDYARDFQEV